MTGGCNYQCFCFLLTNKAAKNLKSAFVVLTTGKDEVWRTQQYVGEGLQEAKIHQICEEANSHHQHWEAFKNIETCQHTCGGLDTCP